MAANTAEIAGEFKGEIKAERLLLLEKARVSGTLEARSLAVREGAQLNGSVNAGEPRRPAAAPPGPQRPCRGTRHRLILRELAARLGCGLRG